MGDVIIVALASYPPDGLMNQVGDTAFVHGGLSLCHLGRGGLDAIRRINDDVARFLAGASPKPPAAALRGGALWMRCLSAR